MNCHELERWIDEGMPEAGRANALRHAESCVGCAEFVAAAAAVEAMLREEPLGAAPTPAPAGFTDAVLAHIEDAAPGGARVPAASQREPWWITWALDPASVVAMTAAVVLAAIARWHPAWFLDPGLIWITRTSKWTADAVADANASFRATSSVWIAIGIGFAPLALWGLWTFARRIERLLLLFTAR